MAAERYNIEGERLTLREIVQRCETLAAENADCKRYFVGRETIRGRLRCGRKTWAELTAKVMTLSNRPHPWRDRDKDKVKPRDSGLYEPEDYVGPDLELDKYDC